MADPVELGSQTKIVDTITEARDSVQKEAQSAQANPLLLNVLITKLRQELKDAEIPGKEFAENAKKVEVGQALPVKQAEGVMAMRTIIRAVEAAKKGIVVSKTTQGQEILVKLAKESYTSLSVASAIEANLADYLIGNKSITVSTQAGTKSDFERAFENLKSDSITAAKLIGPMIINLAKDGEIPGLTEDIARDKFEVKEEEERKKAIEELRKTQREGPRGRHRKTAEEATPEELEAFIDDLKERHFDLYLTEKDKEFLRIIYFPTEFVKYVEQHVDEKRKAFEKDGKTFSEKIEAEAFEEISMTLEHKLIEVVDNILTRFSETNPEKYFEQVASENFMQGITTTLATLGSFLDRLKRGLEEYEVDNPTKDTHLYRSVGLDPIKEDILIEYKNEKGETVYVEKPRTRYKPLSKPEAVSLSGFASYMRLMMDEYIGEREYLHNARSILLHPKDPQQGFYAVLGNYAEKMKTPALEEMFLFPNADLLQDAINLYDKYVDEQFASQDWQHTSDMFLPRTGTVTTRLEQEVLEALKKMHPEIKEETKLKSALFMAIGAHRGIFMTEEEKAAFAEPHLTPEGKPTYTSYYTNDTDPLTPLNPAHFFWRWQAERSIPLWLFLPVEGYKSPLAGTGTVGVWNHRDLWKNLQKYKESFYKGRDEMIKDPLLIDFMLDIANVGGPSKRRGWRIYYTTEGHFVFKEEKDKTTGKLKPTGKVDVLKTWQAIENIGYELCYDFIYIPSRMGADFLKAKYENSAEKREFFKYLYENYFISDPAKFNESNLNSFLNNLDGKAKELADLKLKRRMITRGELDDQIETERSNLFLSETLARLVAKRFPTKILRIDRDRFNKPTRDKDGNIIASGKSRWNKVREQMGLSTVEFDKVMKNLCLAEALLRKDVSAEMKKKIKEYARRSGKSLEDKDMGFHLDEVREGLDFRLTEKKIRDYLSQHNRTEGKELDQVIQLYQFLQQDYIGENPESQEFMHTFSRYLNPNITEEGSYTYTFGLDDTDMSLVAFRGAGGRLLARAIKDTGAAEKNVTDEMMHLEEKLHAAAIDGKHDFSEIVATLAKIRTTLTDIHGPHYAQKVAHHMSLAVINFFKKDTVSRNIITKWFVTGQPHSLAAEIYGGGLANIWEWDVGTIDQFIFRLRTARVLPQQPYDPSAGSPYVEKDLELPWFGGGKIKLGKYKTLRNPDSEWYEGSLRRDAGAQTIHKLWEGLNTVVPLFLIWLLWQYLSKAFRETEGQGQRK